MAVITKPTTAGVDPRLMLKRYATSSYDMLNSLIVLLYGPESSGKTTAACTASAYWDWDKIAKGEPIVLLDTAMVAYDSNPTSSLAQFGVIVPTVVEVFKMMTYPPKGEDGTETGKLFNNVRHFEQEILFPLLTLCAQEGITNFIFDGINVRGDSVHRTLQAEAQAALEAEQQGRKVNKLDIWTELKTEHASFISSIANFPGNKILVAHSAVKDAGTLVIGKAEVVAAQERAKELQKLATNPAASKIGIAIPGQGGNPYFERPDMAIPVRFRLNPKTGKLDRFFTTNIDDPTWRVKNRFSGFTDPEEPADLGKLINKIKEKTKQAFTKKGETTT